MVSRIAGLRVDVAGVLAAVEQREVGDRQFDRQHLCTRFLHRAARYRLAERALRRPVHSRSRRQPHSDGRGPARPSLRQTVAAMSAYLDGINKFASAGELPPVVVAALGPKMLALSGAKSRGAVPYNVTRQHTAEAAAVLGPSKWLAVEQKITLETNPAKARALGRKELSRYM